jgi:glycosyltransferase involved in cell wall biosynthesis
MSFRELFEAANRLWEEDRLDEAEAAFLGLLREDPESAALMCRLGDIYRRKNDQVAAKGYFGRALEQTPDFPWSHFGLGQLAEAEGEFTAALEYYRETLARQPGLSAVIEAVSRTERLLADDARRRREEHAHSFQERFTAANRLLDDHQLAEAEVIYRDLLEIDPRSAALLCKMGDIAAQLGREGDALAFFDEAKACDPNFAWSFVGRSELFAAAEDFAGAIASLEHALALDSSLTFIPSRLEQLRRQARDQADRHGPPEIREWPATKSPLARDDGRRLRVVVAAWDLTHNPAGRAWLLADLTSAFADCELVGPMFPAYGDDLWTPLRECPHAFSIRAFAASSFAKFLAGAIRLVAEKPCDIVWVSKPRFPSLLIGFLYKLIHRAHVICDIDDDELAFVNADRPLELDEFMATAGPSDWKEPFSARWTQLAQSMIGSADAITVCNPVLQEKHGGILIRHARDERAFDPALIDRQAIRGELGLSGADKVVLFLGTARRHKGIIALAEALDRIGDPSAVLCIIGSIPERPLKEELERFRSLRLLTRPDVPFSKLPGLNAAADLVCILQNPENPISRFQTPAKLTDALAMGTPVLAASVPPIDDLIAPAGIATAKDGDLVATLRIMLSAETAPSDIEKKRRFFLSELSYEMNAARARTAMESARSKQTPVPNGFVRLLRHIEACMPGNLDPEIARHLGGILPTGPRAAPLRSIERALNVVFFWKQNDSGLYGRRQDMLLAELGRLPRIRRILHVDAPISIDRLEKIASPSSERLDEGRFVATSTVERFLCAQDDGKIHRRAFVHRGHSTSLLGRELAYKEAFPNMVESWLRELDMLENCIAWVCPVVPMFPEVQKRIGFPFIVADVIDDQRQWPMTATWRAQLERNYRETFAATNVAIANCQPVADWLMTEDLDPIVVPNGLEIHRDLDDWPVPLPLAEMRRPIVGYAGNLNDRIDWSLITTIADARPHWSIVLIGATPKNARFREVAVRPNIHAIGVLPYRQAVQHIAALDAAMIPHLGNNLSERMNPLKLYVYRSLGIPVVSTPVANLGDLSNEIRIAGTADAFIAGLEQAIDAKRHYGRSFPDPVQMRALSWESRVAAIFDRVEQVFRGRAGPAACEAVG